MTKRPDLQPTIDAAYAKLEAECDAIRASIPPIKGDWGLMEPDTFAIMEACRPLRDAYHAWLRTDPVAQAEREAFMAWDATQPDDEPVEEDDDTDEDEDEEA